MENRNLAVHASEIRRNIIKMISKAKSGHPGGALSAVEILTYLYFNEMNVTKDNVSSNQRDRFVLSKGHASALVYAVLAEKGLLDKDMLTSFRAIDSKLQGHPNMNYIEGVDMSTGSLGQGISCAVGMAMANKLDNNPYRVFFLLGDGESQEGQVWEAAMAAAHYKLNNLIGFLDFNGLQIDGDIKDVMNPTPLDEKFKAFGWEVFMIDGHNYDEIKTALDQAKKVEDKPVMIIAKTIKGKGVSYMENNAGWHGNAPSEEQCKQALEELKGE